MSKALSLTEQMQYVYAAIQHLQHDRSTVDLADELGVSRFMVGRMIKRARDERLIEVKANLPDPIDTALSKSLALAYGLDSAIIVVAASDEEEPIRAAIATLAARFLAETFEEDDIVGLGPGRTILETCMRISDVPSFDVVQLTGVATFDREQHLDAIVRLSHVAKGRMFALHAPMLATNERSWRAITGEPAVKQALARIDRINKAVLTVGGWPHSSVLSSQLAELGEREALQNRGVVAEIGSTLLDADGAEVRGFDNRIIGISTQQLERVPLRIAVGGGPGKERAVIAALRSGLVDVAVTDQRTARAALDARQL